MDEEQEDEEQEGEPMEAEDEEEADSSGEPIEPLIDALFEEIEELRIKVSIDEAEKQ